MTWFLIAQVLWIGPQAPPLPPADAVAVLVASGSDRNFTGKALVAPPELPRVIILPAPRPVPTARNKRVLSPAEVPWATRQAVPWVHVGQSFTPVIDVRIVGEPRPARTAASR
ncbi:MAG: hypothetical protein ACREF4_13955 [Gammaproteobacteria bacterium]